MTLSDDEVEGVFALWTQVLRLWTKRPLDDIVNADTLWFPGIIDQPLEVTFDGEWKEFNYVISSPNGWSLTVQDGPDDFPHIIDTEGDVEALRADLVYFKLKHS